MESLFRALPTMVAVALLATAGGGFGQVQVDASDRSDVVRLYHEVYLAAEDYEEHHGWSGSVAACQAGTLSDELHADTISRVNYFRAMAGLPSAITLSPELNAKCQQAALMMARNGQLSHTPATTWHCYTADGAEAAASSNLSYGINTPHYGPAAVDGQIEDEGAGNEGVGHRRWILSTRAPDQMGHGSIPLSPVTGNASQENTAMALWVVGSSTSELRDDFEFVAWPPAGFVPHDLAYRRWSFAIPGADMDSAQVTVTGPAGEAVSAPVIHRTSRGGDSTIVFEPQGFPVADAPLEDQTYKVTVSGIGGAAESSYSYEVTIIDGHSMPPVALSGSETGYVGHASSFGFTPFAAAHCYEMRVFETAAGDWNAGAESGEKLIDGTTADHPLRTSTFSSSGSRAYHMTWAGESFELDRDILPTESSELRFSHRFRWVGNTTSLVAEVAGSTGTWTEVWRRTGNLQGSAGAGNWEPSWQSANISLADYAGQTVRLRFRYHRDAGGYGWFPDYPGDQFHEFGALVDDIEVTSSLEIASESVTSLPAGTSSAAFTPDATGEYQVQLRPQIAGIWFGFSPPLVIDAIVGTPPVLELEIAGAGLDTTGAFYIDATASGYASVKVQCSDDGGVTWTDDDSFPVPAVTGSSFRLTSSAPASGDRIFRLAAAE